jgi:hypothetical protein
MPESQPDTTLSALVVDYLEQLPGRMDEFARLEALQRDISRDPAEQQRPSAPTTS